MDGRISCSQSDSIAGHGKGQLGAVLLLFAQFQTRCDPFHLMVCVACIGLDSDLNAFVQLLRIGHVQAVGGIQHDVCIRHAAQRKGGENGCR